jgi:hypothetical protein
MKPPVNQILVARYLMNRFPFVVPAVLAVACMPWSHAGASTQTAPSHVHSPAAVHGLTRDTTAVCHDKTLSTSHNSSGACSKHGGVKSWFGTQPKGATARCKDGTYSKSSSSQGACSSHGGVAFDLKTKSRG